MRKKWSNSGTSKINFNRWIKRWEDGILCQLPYLAVIAWQYCWEDNEIERNNILHFSCQAYHIFGAQNLQVTFLYLCACDPEKSEEQRWVEWTRESQKGATTEFPPQVLTESLKSVTGWDSCPWCNSQPSLSSSSPPFFCLNRICLALLNLSYSFLLFLFFSFC